MRRVFRLGSAAVHKLLPSVKKRRAEIYWLLAYALAPTFLLACAVHAWVREAAVLQELRARVFDSYQRLKPREYLVRQEDGRMLAPPVRVIALDDESLARLGQWPWPRALVARLVRRLGEAGVAAIAFDIVFSEPDRTSPARLAEELSGVAGMEGLRVRLRGLADHDRTLARAFGEAAVVAGFALTREDNAVRPALKRGFAFSSMQSGEGGRVTAEDLALGEEQLRRKLAGFRGGAGVQDPKDYLPGYYAGAVNNLPVLEAAAAGNGNFSVLPDQDGIIRRVPLLYRLGDEVYPALALEALRLALGGGGYKVMASGGHGQLDWGEWNGIVHVTVARKELQFEIPTDARGDVLLYDTGHRPERFIPAWKVLEGQVGRERLEGAIVFVGATAAGLMDLRATPLNQVTPGAEIHAQLTEQALAREFLRRPVWAKPLEFSFLLVFGLGLVFLMARLGAAWCATLAGAGVAASACASWWAFSRHQLLLDPVSPSLVVLLVYLCASLINHLRSEAEKKEVRAAFSRYMSPDLVEQLARDPSRLKLGGETRELTIMFSDIRGFTTISEQFDAHGLTEFINRYLTPMTGIVLDHRGTIDKYIGDCIMAFWNAPLDDADHARNACLAAIAMRSRLRELNERWRAAAEAAGRRHIPIKTGIGLNTGPCCVGNLGSEQRFDYSVLGDDVNLASRLEGQSKNYGVDVVIGENTRAKTAAFAALELDLIRVKGKTVPVRVYALLGDEARAKTAEFQELAARHAAALKAYRAREWDRAEKLIEECRRLDPSLEGLYALYVRRIGNYRAEPPAADWDGAYMATSK